MTRYRLVHVQNGVEHVSSVVIAPDEIPDHLHAEAVLHQTTGWAVYEEPGERVVAIRPGVRREVFCRAYDALEDSGWPQSEEAAPAIVRYRRWA